MFWTYPSGRTLDVLIERQTTTVELPISDTLIPLSSNDAKLEIISGEIPAGMRIDGT